MDLVPPRPGLALELGCGDGKTLKSLLSSGQVVSLDFSRRALLSCRHRLPLGPLSELVQGEMATLPFADAVFDLVLAHHVLEHLYEEERTSLAEEIVRVLKPGGALDLRAFSCGDMRQGKGREVERSTFLREGILYHYFTEEELGGLFGRLVLDEMCTSVTEKRFSGAVHRRSVILGRFHNKAL